ncbi:MAG: amino acid adenylation domain-containing protein [Acidobacteriota bacterium]|nr:amino acid adenylation domain-containing protein [Acidobacteriota bacterium]
MTTQVTEAFRMSPQQRQAWSRWQAAGADAGVPANAETQCRAVLELEGPLDPQRLRRALEVVVGRHESLRTLYRRQAGMRWPLQVLAEELTFGWAEGEGAVSPQLDAEAGPILGACLEKLGAERHRLILNLVPMAADALSLKAVASELSAAYGDPEAAPTEEEALQYVQFSEWQLEVAEESAEDEVPVTLRAAAQMEPPRLPLARPAAEGAVGPQRMAAVALAWSSELGDRLARCASAAAVSEEALLLAAWRVFLSALAGAHGGVLEDGGALAVEVAFDGRKFEEFEGAVGLFARRFPLALDGVGDFSAEELARRTQKLLDQAREHQELLGNQDALGADAVTFEMLPGGRRWRAGALSVTLAECSGGALPALCGLRCTGSPVSGLELCFDASRLSLEVAENWIAGFRTLLVAALEDPHRPARRLPRLGDREREALRRAGGLPLAAEAQGAPKSETLLLARLAAWARREPGRTALIGPGLVGPSALRREGSRRLTYGELWEQAGAFAAALRQRGAGPGQVVGLLLERSVETVVAMVGAWRAGAAYLPLDPSLPAGRLAQLVDAAAVRLVVAERAGEIEVPASCAVLALDELAEPAEAAADPSSAPASGLAYVLFTSGSTGRPKGVQVEHGNLAAYLGAAERRLQTSGMGSWAMISTFAADLGLTGLLLGLTGGACVHVATAQQASDPAAFARLMAGEGGDGTAVDGLKIVPSHLQALLSGQDPAAVLPRRRLVLGGEACPPELVQQIRRLAPGLEVFNHYGPTETTIGVIAGAMPEAGPVDLGRVMDHAYFVLCDRWGEPVGHGVEGELYLGGLGVARGYLRRPAETAERFVPDFWSGEPGVRLYRTGDRGRLEADGRLFFVGRVDDQVKVRGYRVELGEVEAVLRQHRQVRQAVVHFHDEERGAGLVAYVVQRPGPQIAPAELQEHLASRLPDYMLPRVYAFLDTLPINANGKVDRRALPAPDQAAAARSYAPPRNETEELLAMLWQRALGIERVGIRDDFFALGGDSILAIQLIGKAAQEGLRFTPQQLFEHRNIEQLAPWVGTAAAVSAEQGPVVGELPLVPIQRWFFAGSRRHPEHFNQSLLLATPRPLRGEILRRVLALLVQHHDVLRCRFAAGSTGGWTAEIPAEGEIPLEEHDLSELPAAERRARLEALCAEAQEGFDLTRGPLFQALALDLGEAGGRLLLASHHLLVDGVSWRVLLSDLEQAYRALEQGETPRLPAKSTSFLHWARELARAVTDGRFDDQLSYWLAATEELAGSSGEESGGGPVGLSRRVFRSLDRELTRALLQEVPPVYNTQINDALLAALTLAYGEVYGTPRLVVDLEGHGREDVLGEVDLSRTVGWFTTHYPVCIDLEAAQEPGPALVQTKESLRAVPRAGIGYGLLRWLGQGEEHRRLRARRDPALSFNYLGQLDGVLEEDAQMRLAPEASGPERAPDELRSYRFEVSGSVLDGRLQLAVTFSPEVDEGAMVDRWVEAACRRLEVLIEHCRDPEAGGFTPSDFPLADLASADLDQISGLLDHLEDEPEKAGP